MRDTIIVSPTVLRPDCSGEWKSVIVICNDGTKKRIATIDAKLVKTGKYLRQEEPCVPYS